MDCAQLKSSVLRWFGEEIECHPTDRDALIATLPLLKPNGDSIEIGIAPVGSRLWKLSDLGDTHSTLFVSGVELSDAYVRGYEFRQIVGAHGIQDEGGELAVEADEDELVTKLFDFVHAIQSMLALQFTVKPEQPSRDFASIVAKFLAEQRASFDALTDVQGKTGKWKFQFTLNHVRQETLIKTLSANGRSDALHRSQEGVFEIRDVREVRDVDVIVIADDEGDREEFWGEHVKRIFDGYGIPLYPFEGGREDLIKLAKQYAYPGT